MIDEGLNDKDEDLLARLAGCAVAVARRKKRMLGLSIMLMLAVGAFASPPEPPVIATLDGEPISSWLHEFSGLPMTPDGWTDIHAMIMSPGYSDARIVYVSTAGNDSTAVIYNQTSPSLGGRPLEPVGAVAAYSSIQTAYNQLRDGYPDVMLLRRGDSWDVALDVLKKGRSNSERLIIGAYGRESDPRPVVTRVSQSYFNSTAEFQVLSSIVTRGGAWYSGKNLLIEDFMWNGSSSTNAPITLALTNEGFSTLRRNTGNWAALFSGPWRDQQQASEFATRVEENTLSKTALSSNGATHNVYFGEGGANIQSVDNQSIDSAGAGWRQREGGVVRGNLIIGYQAGHPNGFAGGLDLHQNMNAQYNVVLHAGQSLAVFAMLNATYSNNIIVGNSNYPPWQFTVDARQGQRFGHDGNNVIADNIVFGSGPGPQFRFDTANLDGLGSGATLSVMRNDFIRTGDGTVMSVVQDPRVAYSGNRYHSSSPPGDWFGGAVHDAMIPETGEAASPAVYPDPDRNILTYMRSLGANPRDWRQAMDWYQHGVPGNPSLAGAINNRRGAWDARFTSRAVINYIREGFGVEPY